MLLWVLLPTTLTYWNEFSGGKRTTRLQRRSRRDLTAVFDYLKERQQQKRLSWSLPGGAQRKENR